MFWKNKNKFIQKPNTICINDIFRDDNNSKKCANNQRIFLSYLFIYSKMEEFGKSLVASTAFDLFV